MRACELGYMLAVYTGVKDYEVNGSETQRSTIHNLLSWGLIEEALDTPTGFQPTERGAAFVEMLKLTPLPEQRWVDPRSDDK